jgi:hypothetical protein
MKYIIRYTAGEDGRWYAAIINSHGKELAGDGWYDTKAEAKAAAEKIFFEDESE